MVVSAAVNDDCTGVRASPASGGGAGAAAGMAWPARGSRKPACGAQDKHHRMPQRTDWTLDTVLGTTTLFLVVVRHGPCA
jgi:hypothetical protein